jgi:hypothetical protein
MRSRVIALLGCALLVACKGQDDRPATSKPAMAAPPVAQDAAAVVVDAAAADPLRRYGFPTRDQCLDAIDPALDAIMRDPAWNDTLSGSLGRKENADAMLRECVRDYYLAKVDCIGAARTLEAYRACLVADYLPPWNLDIADGPGHPSELACGAAIEHLAKLEPKRYPAGSRVKDIRRCRNHLRPVMLDCVMAASTFAAVERCELPLIWWE